MNEEGEKFVHISKEADLYSLIERINKGPSLAYKFKFADRGYLVDLLDRLNIDYKEFTKSYYYYDRTRRLHISESEFGYVWISTYGLIPGDKTTPNKEVNACVNQYLTVSLLLDKAIEISNSERVYDIDGYDFNVLSQLSPALFHNLLFFIEVFCKAYLSLSDVKVPRGHKLSDVYLKLIEAMYQRNHNDSMFQIGIVDPFMKIIEYVGTISGDFKEQFVKYDDNPEDATVISFQSESLNEIKNIIGLSNDFINDYFYIGSKSHYLKSGLLADMLNEAKTENEKNKLRITYRHLKPKNKLEWKYPGTKKNY
jgi:hypothetical protein